MIKSISLKFNLLAGCLVASVLLTSAFYDHFQTEKALKDTLDKQTDLTLDRLALNLPINLWKFETDKVLSIIDSEINAPEVRAVYVYDTQRLVAGKQLDDNGVITDVEAPSEIDVIKERSLFFQDSGVDNNVGRVVVVYEGGIRSLLESAAYRSLGEAGLPSFRRTLIYFNLKHMGGPHDQS